MISGLDKIHESTELTSDDLAKQEDRHLFEDKERAGNIRKHVHKIIVIIIWVFFFAFCVLLLTRISHFILPKCWFWLCDDQLKAMDNLIYSGAIGSFVGRYITTSLNNEKK